MLLDLLPLQQPTTPTAPPPAAPWGRPRPVQPVLHDQGAIRLTLTLSGRPHLTAAGTLTAPTVTLTGRATAARASGALRLHTALSAPAAHLTSSGVLSGRLWLRQAAPLPPLLLLLDLLDEWDAEDDD